MKLIIASNNAHKLIEIKEILGSDNDECMAKLVKFCRANISPARLKGFLMASWADAPGPGSNYLDASFAGIDQLAAALKS